MIFVPHIIRCADNISIPVDISSASADDIVATYGSPSWQTDWDSPYLSNPDVSKYAMKAPNGELIALAAHAARLEALCGTNAAFDNLHNCFLLLKSEV